MSAELAVRIAVLLLQVVVEIIGKENTKALLSAEGVRRANLEADIAERIKFGGRS